MNISTNPLFLMNNDFITQIVSQQRHDVYACITALDFKEQPISQIQGKITTGSINIDGDSNIRRTCSLTLVSDDININDIYWGIKTKFKLDIGLYNNLIGEYAISNNYPEIVWFSQGYYIISSFNTSISTNNISISIQGKDKMCLLNGDLGGQLTSAVDFGTEETISEDMIPITIDKKQFNNSNKLMQTYQNRYYIKEMYKEKIYKTEAIDINRHPKYIFIKDNIEGNFYTVDKNIFKKGVSSLARSSKYSIYKLIEEPKELFQDSSAQIDITYHHDQDNDTYFILDSTTSDISNNNFSHYSLVPIYEQNISINKIKIPIDKIIREAVHAYAQEPYQNIIINDLAQYGLEKMTYKGDTTVYILYNTSTGEDEQIYFGSQNNSLSNIVNSWSEDDFYNFQTGEGKNIYIKNDNNEYQETANGTVSYKVKKYSYGDDIGYQLTDLTYAGDLICNEGEALTSMLDKIKTMLGEFEYFYNHEGKFVFQKKKNYFQTSWTQLTSDEQGEPYIDFEKDKVSFNFEQNQLLSSISNSPVLNNIHNDITVWGKRKGISGAEIPIHARYAINKKPKYYKTLQGKTYYTKEYQFLNKEQYYTKDYHMRNPTKDLIIGADTTLFVCTLNNDYANCWWNLFTLLDFYKNVLNISIDDNAPLSSLFSKTHSSSSELKNKTFNLLAQENIDMSSLNMEQDIDCFSLCENDNKYTLSISNGQQSISYYKWHYETNSNQQYYVYVPSVLPSKEDENSLCVDWRELIYQMALDYFAAQGCSQDNPLLIENGKMIYPEDMLYEIGHQNPEYFPSGYTGYEQYYTDMQGFWRQLYNPDYIPSITSSGGQYTQEKEWQEGEKIYNFEYYFDKSNININQFAEAPDYQIFALNEGDEKLYWNRAVFLEPETLDFWFDFIDCDEQADLVKFSIPQIGNRNKVVKEDKASSIIFKEAPNIVFYLNENKSDEEKQKIANTVSGYSSINLPSKYLQYFSISTKSLSVKNKLDELLYQYTYCTENITINSIPIYHLQPNTRIFVKDDKTEINGEYIIHKLTIPLTYNGTMSISASKAPERLY